MCNMLTRLTTILLEAIRQESASVTPHLRPCLPLHDKELLNISEVRHDVAKGRSVLACA